MNTSLDYISAGLALVPIPKGTKGPTTTGWNLPQNCIRTASDLSKINGGNIGLAHAFSNPPTGALDIDNYTAACEWFRDKGVDLDSLLTADNAVQIRSGRENRAKLLYRLPFPLTQKKIKDSQGDDIIDFRCAASNGVTVQDVLPPSIHPGTGKPYEWGGSGDFHNLPEIPPELLAVWQQLLSNTPETENLDRTASLSEKVEQLIGTDPKVQTVWNGEPTATQQDTSRNGFDMTLVALLKVRGCTAEEAAAALMAFQHGKFPERKDQYFWDMWEKVEIAKISFGEVVNAAETLDEESHPEAINAVLEKAKFLDSVSQDRILKLVKKHTKVGIGLLKQALKEQDGKQDRPLKIVETALSAHWADGAHLIRGIDRSFWGYTGSHWARMTDEQVKRILLDVIASEVPPGLADYSSTMNAAFNLLTARQAAEGDVLHLTEEPPPVVNCLNGELWIDDDGKVELRKHRADSFLTYVLNVEYDPEAQCPKFDKALQEIFPEDTNEMIRHVMEIFGHAIQARRDIPAIIMFIGGGANAKSKLAETIQALMNTSAIYADRIGDIETHQFKIGALAGKLLLVDDDVSEATRLPDGFLKKVSERKLLSGQLKFKDSFEFIACCLPLLLANNPPIAKDLSYGLRRRVHIIPFDRVFHPDTETAKKKGDPEAVADPKLFPKIWRSELPGILNHAREGLQRLRQRGRFEDPQRCIEARRQWLAAANPLVSFIEDNCSHDAAKHILIRSFFTALQTWAEDEGIRSLPPRNTIKRQMEALGYETKDTKHGKAIVGLYLQRGDGGF
ncbi:MAG: phage/plasmid primase, P4 family [Candidatus Sedimenticola sp. 6PFRAG1]